MVFIIVGHLAKSMDIESYWGSSMYFILNGIKSFTIVAVNVYILISGFFGIRFSFKKLGKLGFEVLFYSLVFLVIFVIPHGVGRNSFIYFFPITSDLLWFVGAYYVLVICSPFINRALLSFDIKQLRVVVIAGFLLFYIWPTISYIFNFRQVVNDAGYGPVNFIMLYIIGRYIRRICDQKLAIVQSWIKWFAVYLLSSLLLFVSQSLYSNLLGFSFTSLYSYNTLFVLLGAISLFMTFYNIRINSAIINYLAKNCFAAYVIHTIFPILIPLINQQNGFLISHMVFIPLILFLDGIVIYLLCVFVESLRVRLMNGFESHLTRIILSINPIKEIELALKSIDDK